MNIPTLGALVEVDLRSVWHHEAQSFTPWLVEHLGTLAEVIGIPLELEGREVSVERFAADILARNPQDDTRVLIENQLDASDHKHLGQIMTYLAGLDAHTIIWIAAEFREPHLCALQWLNDQTHDGISFFAVRVKAVQIDNSPIAPIFEVVLKPNNWERQLQAIAHNKGQLSELGQHRKAFWTHYLNRFPQENHDDYPADAAISRWRVLEDLELVVAAFLSNKYVGVFIRGRRGVSTETIYAKLEPYKDELTTCLKADMGSQFLFASRCFEDTTNQAHWNRLTDWLHYQMNIYETTLRELMGKA